MEWLRMIKEHIISSVHIEKDDLDYTPFDGPGWHWGDVPAIRR